MEDMEVEDTAQEESMRPTEGGGSMRAEQRSVGAEEEGTGGEEDGEVEGRGHAARRQRQQPRRSARRARSRSNQQRRSSPSDPGKRKWFVQPRL